MRLIDRYLLRQLLGPTLLATAALTGVALLSTSLSTLDLIVNQHQSAMVFLKLTLLAMPQLTNLILPIAMFVAALVALNRLHTEQEIVVCFAGGMSRWRVISPAIRLAATVTLLALVMNLWAQPLAYRALRQVLFDVRTDLAATLVREGEFTEPAPGLTVYAQSVDNKGDMHNLFIHQVKENGGATTYMANTGHIARRKGAPVLMLENGSTQEFSDRGVLNYLTFNEYPFELSELTNQDEMIHYKPSDLYLHELFFPDLQQGWEQRNRKALLAEGNARIATPLYNIAAMALALSAIIGGGFSRLGYARRIAMMGGVAILVRILGFVAQSASERDVWINALQYAIPLSATAFGLRAIFRQRVSRFIDIRRRPARIAPVPA
ncbi:MAG TPA: LPS export ABC transporter permease LptF [Phenylobacterium sp.]|jgi:lipopolysaccharide export system permease protein|uniref:LPS export ABC transporter permease LptF n=1 Tax=Phenylobacterium sp. TaxID=1871053 RepID=UPI002BEE58A6|nr:LPS export ABC transporter permease LptF [Phenylobacterium sp.]HXA39530.1 LPS export ABC transporter permease LptF [Phenylobacterium sp.]